MVRSSLDVRHLHLARDFRYIFFYQTPFIPELLIEANDFGMFTRAFYDKPMGLTNKENMTKDDLEVFKYTFSQKGMSISRAITRSHVFIVAGTTTAAVNYYRALLRYPRDPSKNQIKLPVLILWGCQDAALGEPLADASRNYCSDVQLKKFPQASHWIQQDEPEEVNKSMETFLAK